MGKRHLSRLVHGFAIAAVLICSEGLAKGQQNPELSTPEQTAYLVDNTSNGKRVYFPTYESLPPSWQRFLDKSSDAEEYKAKNGKDLYGRLSRSVRVGLLNILLKASTTLLPDGSTVLDHISKANRLKQDRIFVEVDSGLQEEMAAGASKGIFQRQVKLDNLLHRHCHDGDVVGNYKTADNRGGLQTIIRKKGSSYTGEEDLDEEKPGLVHFLRAAEHTLFHRKTNPFVIGRILEKYQAMHPLYRLSPPESERPALGLLSSSRTLDHP